MLINELCQAVTFGALARLLIDKALFKSLKSGLLALLALLVIVLGGP